MRHAACWLMVACFILVPSDALAYPEGPPWGAANPEHPDHCASCHWERAPRFASTQSEIRGLPDIIKPGGRYKLRLVFSDPAAEIAGFQSIMEGDGEPSGSLITNDPTTEVATFGTQLRTIAPKSLLAGRVVWDFQWQAPAKLASDVRIYIAVSAANDDGSPFGDAVHYNTVKIAAP